MERQDQNVRSDLYTVDLLHILKRLWYRIWAIALCGIIGAVAGFSIANFAVTPMYSSSILLYVNNNSISLGNTSVTFSASEISAAQSLVRTYIVILKNRTTLEMVVDRSGLDYTANDIAGMITANAVDETEVMQVSVKCEDPYKAAKIANTIAEVLPTRLAEIIEGSSMEVVDSAIPNTQRVSPSFTLYTVAGFFIGVFIAAAIVTIAAMMDTTVHDEEYVLQTYKYPILAKVPNLFDYNRKRYGYYYRKYYGSNKYYGSQPDEKDGE